MNIYKDIYKVFLDRFVDNNNLEQYMQVANGDYLDGIINIMDDITDNQGHQISNPTCPYSDSKNLDHIQNYNNLLRCKTSKRIFNLPYRKRENKDHNYTALTDEKAQNIFKNMSEYMRNPLLTLYDLRQVGFSQHTMQKYNAIIHMEIHDPAYAMLAAKYGIQLISIRISKKAANHEDAVYRVTRYMNAVKGSNSEILLTCNKMDDIYCALECNVHGIIITPDLLNKLLGI